MHQCTNNGLTGTSWWLDSNNKTHYYWSGDYTTNVTGCACSLEGGQCNANMFGQRVRMTQTFYLKLCYYKGKCNCDSFGDGNTDEGVLTNKDQLPVSQVAYGGGSGLYNFILYKLGYLECIGKDSGELYPGEIDDSDYYFKYYAS